MRVLHVAGGDLYGGIERMLATFAAIRSDVLAQQFAVSPTGRLSRELRRMGAVLASLPRARASRPISVLVARREFARMLRDLKPDAAVFHGSWPHAVFATVARERGCLVAFWQHTPIVQPQWPDRWASWTAPDVLIANSRFTATAPAFSGIRTHVIHCPVPAAPAVPAEERDAARAALGARGTDVVVLMAARLEAWKGHTILIDAVGMLGNSAVKVWIAGGVQRPVERAYLDQLECAIVSVGLTSAVTLLGEREDVHTLMQLADIYCQPNSAPEPFGIAIAEAMRAGLPCVVSNAGGAAELVDAGTGILTPPGDTQAVAAALSLLIAEPLRRSSMGRAACARAARLTDPAERLADVAAALTLQPVHAE